MPLSKDELLDKSDRASQGNRVSVLSALTPMSSSAVGPNSQCLQNSLLSESQHVKKELTWLESKEAYSYSSPHSRH